MDLEAGDLLETSAAGGAEAEAVVGNGGMIVGKVDATVTTTETDLTSETSEAASENAHSTGTANGNETGSAIHAIPVTASIFPELDGHRPRHYGHVRRCPEEILEMREIRPWGSTRSEQGGAQETGRCLPVPPTRIPCLRPHLSAADLVVAEGEEWDGAGGIGIRGAVGIGRTFTMIEIVTRAVGRRRAGGAGNRTIGIAGIRTSLGTSEMIGRSGTGKTGTATLSVQSRTESHTNLRLQKMSHPRLSPHPHPPLVRSRAASRPRPKSSR